MVTPIRTENTVGVIGNGRLWGMVTPMLLPGFHAWRPSANGIDIDKEKNIMSMRFVAGCDIVIVSPTVHENKLQEALDLSAVDTVFVAVAGSMSDIAARFLQNQCKRQWIAVGFNKRCDGGDKRARLKDMRAAFKKIQPIRSQRYETLIEWLPKLGARIIGRSQPKEEQAA